MGGHWSTICWTDSKDIAEVEEDQALLLDGMNRQVRRRRLLNGKGGRSNSSV